MVAQRVFVEREHPAFLDQCNLAAKLEHCRVIAKDTERGFGCRGKPALHDFDTLRRMHQPEVAPVMGEREEAGP